MAREILEAGQSAADLTRQILAYSGKGRFVMNPVDFSAVAIECRAFVRRFIPPRIELIYEVTSGIPEVCADKSQIQQLMMNLIINAAESFGEEDKGRVLVRTSTRTLPSDFFRTGEENRPGEYVCLEVSDNGSGMDAATQHRIFDPFFTTKFAGRGLGLSAVHGILRGHGGLLRLESAPGLGTTFHIYFPVESSLRPTVEAHRPSRSDRPATILVVDDEATVRSFARTALRLRGYEVLLAESGPDAIDRFATEREDIDAVLLDLTMPGMDGKETFDRLREIDPATPIVLSSGFNRSIAEERFRGSGIAGFLGKPYTGAQLADALSTAIEAYSLNR
jgi:CheY-like chemotaxis protein